MDDIIEIANIFDKRRGNTLFLKLGIVGIVSFLYLVGYVDCCSVHKMA